MKQEIIKLHEGQQVLPERIGYDIAHGANATIMYALDQAIEKEPFYAYAGILPHSQRAVRSGRLFFLRSPWDSPDEKNLIVFPDGTWYAPGHAELRLHSPTGGEHIATLLAWLDPQFWPLARHCDEYMILSYGQGAGDEVRRVRRLSVPWQMPSRMPSGWEPVRDLA